MRKRTPNFQPLSMISNLMTAVQEALADSQAQLANLQEAKDSPHVLDNKLQSRIIQAHTEQNERVLVYLEQCEKWKEGLSI